MFSNAAMIQKKHIIAQISDRSQVMGNENISQPQFFFQIMEQIHDLNLSMGIQRRDSFVKKNDLWLAESSLIEYLQEIFAGGDESHDEWQHQQALNQARDGALLELEYLHEDLYARLEGCPD